MRPSCCGLGPNRTISVRECAVWDQTPHISPAVQPGGATGHLPATGTSILIAVTGWGQEPRRLELLHQIVQEVRGRGVAVATPAGYRTGEVDGDASRLLGSAGGEYGVAEVDRRAEHAPGARSATTEGGALILATLGSLRPALALGGERLG